MQIQDIGAYLKQNPYPGRGIVLGRADDGEHAYYAYFIMGRSANSRNRVLEEAGGAVVTAPADPAKLADPSLIIYTALRHSGSTLIITNGDQTDTIFNALEGGGTFEDALRTRTFEPDAPSYTPRISGAVTRRFGSFCYKLSLLKSAGGNDASVQRFFYEYPAPLPGQGHFIHTYENNGDPLPSFCGEPVPVAMRGPLEAFAHGIWQGLNEENKVAMVAGSLAAGGEERRIVYNQYNKI